MTEVHQRPTAGQFVLSYDFCSLQPCRVGGNVGRGQRAIAGAMERLLELLQSKPMKFVDADQPHPMPIRVAGRDYQWKMSLSTIHRVQITRSQNLCLEIETGRNGCFCGSCLAPASPRYSNLLAAFLRSESRVSYASMVRISALSPDSERRSGHMSEGRPAGDCHFLHKWRWRILRYGRPVLARGEVKAAQEWLRQTSSFASFRKAYDTFLGETWVASFRRPAFSVSQSARAMLKNPADSAFSIEATSSLDCRKRSKLVTTTR